MQFPYTVKLILILTHFNSNLKYIIKTNSSDYALGGVLLQYNKNGKLRLVAFLFRKLAPTKLNYNIYNKELLAIIRYFSDKTFNLYSAVSSFRIYLF